MLFESRNPATGEVVKTYPSLTKGEIEKGLERAWTAWKSWSTTGFAQRAAVLSRMADLLESRVETYAQLIVLEMGKPIGEARAEVKKAASGCRHYVEAGEDYLKPQPIPGLNARVVYESVGPIFGIMPWNLPFWQVLRFFIPLAMAGSTVLVKHAETVQGCAAALEQLVRDAGGPDGLYVNFPIAREDVPAVIADARVRGVTVTGSIPVGRLIARIAGQHGKKAVLELGGSDPFLVFEDANFDKAVEMGVLSRYSNNAQSCIAAKRFIVAESIAPRYVEAFAEKAKALRVGDPMKTETQLGPLARADIRANTERQVSGAKAAGAKLVTGGGAIDGPGYYYAPTVMTGLPTTAPLAQEEFFGPVALMFTFKTEQQAIDLANGTEYGLAATVWSADNQRAARVAARIEAGAVFINDFVRSDPRAPFGGVKGSGFGRELGALGARELTNAKLIFGG